MRNLPAVPPPRASTMPRPVAVSRRDSARDGLLRLAFVVLGACKTGAPPGPATAQDTAMVVQTASQAVAYAPFPRMLDTAAAEPPMRWDSISANRIAAKLGASVGAGEAALACATPNQGAMHGVNSIIAIDRPVFSADTARISVLVRVNTGRGNESLPAALFDFVLVRGAGSWLVLRKTSSLP